MGSNSKDEGTPTLPAVSLFQSPIWGDNWAIDVGRTFKF